MKKFNREYLLKIITKEETTIIRNLDLNFSCKKSTDASLNSASLNIYNLNESHRNLLLHNEEDLSKNVKIELSVGYDGDMFLLFSGSIKSGVLTCDGSTFTNSLTVFDGGYDQQVSNISKVVKTKEEFIDEVCKTFTEIKKGQITSQLQALNTNKVIVGNSYNEINKIIGRNEQFFISDGLLYVLNKKEVLKGDVPVIKAETGLLGIPTKDKENVSFKCLLQTDIRLAGAVKLESKYMPSVNGYYRVNEILTTGATYGGDWSQEIVGVKLENVRQL